jgi:uncharacterized protein YjiS (DUF1127 family)
MPNWTYNNLQFIGKTEESVKQLKDLLKSDESDFDFNNIVPMPQHIFQGNLGQEEREIHGKNNWYDWSIMNWGTKWNACDVTVEQNENVLNYTFDTAWDAPREIVRALEHMKNTILKDISIDWNCTHEDGDEEETLMVADDE